MRFKDIPGHIEIKKELVALVKNDRVPHALLFTGPKGNGKLALALAFASYLQCNGEKGEDKCDQCIACKKTDKIIHPDINFVLPTISAGKKSLPSSQFLTPWREIIRKDIHLDLHDWMQFIQADNKQPNIAKVSVEELIKSYNYKIYEGNKKISIIWSAELLGNEGNRILKLIEEPPQDSLIILVADDTSKVLPTILSRCQIIKAPPFSDEELTEWAKMKDYNNSENLIQLIGIAEGNINALNKLLNEGVNDFFHNLLNWLRICYQGKSSELLEFSEAFAKNSKDNQKNFFRYGLTFLEQTLKSYFLPRENIKMLDSEYDSMLKISKILDQEKIYEIIDLFNKDIRYLERNANVKLLVFDTSLRMHEVLRGRR